MRWRRWISSVNGRLMVGLCLGAVSLLIVLGMLTQRRADRLIRIQAGQQMMMLVQHADDVIDPAMNTDRDDLIRSALEILVSDVQITAVAVQCPRGRSHTAGLWPNNASGMHTWNLAHNPVPPAQSAALDGQILIIQPFHHAHGIHTIRLLVDGPRIVGRLEAWAYQQLLVEWLVLAALAGVSLLALRRWLTGPLKRLESLVGGGASAASFEQATLEMGGAYRRLAQRIGSMADRLEETASRLRRSDLALEAFYQSTPTAMLTVSPDGRIVSANRQALELFGAADAWTLTGLALLDLVRPQDRPRLRQSIDRLAADGACRCELKMELDGQTHELIAHFSFVSDDKGPASDIRLSLQDVTEARALMRQVSEQRHLLDRVINHMSDAILLLGVDGRVVSVNARLGQLLSAPPDTFAGQEYDPEPFWCTLDIKGASDFGQRMRQVRDHPERAYQEQVDARDASYLFNVIPVWDEIRQLIGQLWVVQDVSAEAGHRRLLDQQAAQLRALQAMGRHVADLDGLDDLLDRSVRGLFDVMEVEAVGMALRQRGRDGHCRQLICQNLSFTQLPEGAELARAISSGLMRQVLSGQDTSLWIDVTTAGFWAEAFTGLGLESLAAIPLHAHEEAQGVVWIARRGNEHIERRHLHLLGALAPMLATALHNAHLRERLRSLQLTDPQTGIPNYDQFDLMLRRYANRPGHPWALMLIRVPLRRMVAECGQAAADRAMRRVADAIQRNCRSADQLARFDEQKFALLCPDTDAAQGQVPVDRIRDQLHHLVIERPGGGSMPMTCQIGLAASPDDDTDADLLVHIAWQRLARTSGSDDPSAISRSSAA